PPPRTSSPAPVPAHPRPAHRLPAARRDRRVRPPSSQTAQGPPPADRRRRVDRHIPRQISSHAPAPGEPEKGSGDKTSGVRTKKGPAQGAGPALTGRPATRRPAGYRSSTMPEPYQTTVTSSRIKFLS